MRVSLKRSFLRKIPWYMTIQNSAPHEFKDKECFTAFIIQVSPKENCFIFHTCRDLLAEQKIIIYPGVWASVLQNKERQWVRKEKKELSLAYGQSFGVLSLSLETSLSALITMYLLAYVHTNLLFFSLYIILHMYL